jgi:hypothetical protein
VTEKVPSQSEVQAPESPTTTPVPKAGRDVSWKIAVGVLAVVVVIVAAVVYNVAEQRWGRQAMVTTAVHGIEALIVGDSKALAALSNADVQKQITPQFAQQMSASGLDANFGAFVWNGDKVEVPVSSNLGDGIIVAGPPPDGADVVIFRTMGKLGATTGGLTLARGWSGWVITALTVGASAAPTTSVVPTSTPSGSAPASATP